MFSIGKNKILVEVPEEHNETTKSGIILPTEEKKQDIIGKVVAIGDGVKDIDEGDTILVFNVHPPQIMSYDSKRYLFVDWEQGFYIKL